MCVCVCVCVCVCLDPSMCYCSLVGMYWKEFGPLPMEKTGKKVLNILMLQKGFTYDGNMSDWITVKVRIMDTGKLLGVC